jgi:Lon protease-like protein
MATIELPIFPLGVVLFPGTPQALHIFEPRYRQLLADCLGGTRRFGLSFVRPAQGEDPGPAAGDIGCVAVVRDSHLLADGRSDILAVGEERYVLLEYVASELPYRVARVETFDDDDADVPQLGEIAASVRGAFGHFVAGMQALTDRGTPQVELPADAKQLSFQVSAALEIDTEAKQELLTLRSTSARLETLGRLLRPLNDELERRVRVHVRARGNGKGGATQDIVRAT